jgi:hypothetical protein
MFVSTLRQQYFATYTTGYKKTLLKLKLQPNVYVSPSHFCFTMATELSTKCYILKMPYLKNKVPC